MTQSFEVTGTMLEYSGRKRGGGGGGHVKVI